MTKIKHAVIGSLLFSFFAMAPVLPHFASRKFGPNINGFGSDSYGFLYSMWIYAQPIDGVIRSENRDLLSGYPTGQPISRHIQIGSGVAYQLAGLGMPPVAAYNLIIWLCFMLAYLMAFWIGQALKLSNGVSHLAALVIGLNPYQSLQSADHIDLAMTWPILLDIFLLLRLTLYRDIWAFPMLIALTGLAIFSHPYYLIFLLFINALPLLWFVFTVFSRKEKVSPPYLAAVTAAAAVGGGAILFWRSLFKAEGGLASVERNIQNLYAYSTKIWDFILPPHFSSLFANLTTAFKTAQTMDTGSNFVENTLYPGLLIFFGLAAGAAWACVHRREFKKWLKKNRSLVFVLGNITLIPILFSIAPSFDLFGFEISTPTELVHNFLPQFRTMSRFGYVTAVGMVMVFALLVQHHIRAKKALLVIGAFFVIDLGYLHKGFYSDTDHVPAVYTYLRDSTPPKSVIFEVPFMWGYLSTYWQSYHHRPNFALFDPGDPSFMTLVRTAALDLGGLLNFCRANRVDYLVIHTPQALPLPFKKFETIPDDRQLFFLFARYSYVIPIADIRN